MRKPAFAYAKTKTPISCAVTAQLISAFVFAIRIVQPLSYLNIKFQASNRLLWLCSPVCVGPGQKPRRPVFSQRGSNCVSRVMRTPTCLLVRKNQRLEKLPLIMQADQSFYRSLFRKCRCNCKSERLSFLNCAGWF